MTRSLFSLALETPFYDLYSFAISIVNGLWCVIRRFLDHKFNAEDLAKMLVILKPPSLAVTA